MIQPEPWIRATPRAGPSSAPEAGSPQQRRRLTGQARHGGRDVERPDLEAHVGQLCVPRGPPVQEARQLGGRITARAQGGTRLRPIAPQPLLQQSDRRLEPDAGAPREARAVGRALDDAPPVARTVGSDRACASARTYSSARASASRKASSPTSASSEPASGRPSCSASTSSRSTKAQPCCPASSRPRVDFPTQRRPSRASTRPLTRAPRPRRLG